MATQDVAASVAANIDFVDVNEAIRGKIAQACDIRKIYVVPQDLLWEPPFNLGKSPPADFTVNTLGSSPEAKFEFIDGVFVITGAQKTYKCEQDLSQYIKDYRLLLSLGSDGDTRSFCFKRCRQLEYKFGLFALKVDTLTGTKNESECADNDVSFSSLQRVDNHIHHSAMMSQEHLRDFMKKKLETESDTIVMVDRKTKEEKTLQQVFDKYGMNAQNLTLDRLGMHGYDSYQRFDRFNAQFNPAGASEFRLIFLKYSNHIKGRYIGELTQEMMAKIEARQNHNVEPRLSIYGKNPDEWQNLAEWVLNYKLFSPKFRWMIQIPRIYPIWRKIGVVQNFGEVVDNFFRPLFQATINPKSYPEIATFLLYVVGFDSVDNEGTQDVKLPIFPVATEWNSSDNPPYQYWNYYMAANMTVLNKLRKDLGLNTFRYRPHAGETGSTDHLAATYMSANAINHGINLWENNFLQYLYYLDQIPISVSVLSNNLLFQRLAANPFYRLFRRGLHVTLSTDDPLIIHHSRDPLTEEYAMAAHIWRITQYELCEIVRNSIIHSGFERSWKVKYLGENFLENPNTEKTDMSEVRFSFRKQALACEKKLMKLFNKV